MASLLRNSVKGLTLALMMPVCNCTTTPNNSVRVKVHVDAQSMLDASARFARPQDRPTGRIFWQDIHGAELDLGNCVNVTDLELRLEVALNAKKHPHIKLGRCNKPILRLFAIYYADPDAAGAKRKLSDGWIAQGWWRGCTSLIHTDNLYTELDNVLQKAIRDKQELVCLDLVTISDKVHYMDVFKH